MTSKLLRTPVRTLFTKVHKEFLEEAAKSPTDLEKLEIQIRKLQGHMNKLVNLDNAVEQELLNTGADESQLEAEYESVTTYRDKMVEAEIKFEKIQKKHEDGATSTTEPEGIDSPSTRKKGVKLPKWELPEFNGDIAKWMPFWSQFQKIHEDKELADADKLSYLYQCMAKGSEAYEIVASFPLTSDNYEPVVHTLRERYGREDLQIQYHVRQLIKLVIQKSVSETPPSISSLYVQLTAKLRALESLNVTTDKCATMLYPLVMSCLPQDIMIAWERNKSQLKLSNSEAELEQLMKFLQNEVRGEDHIKQAQVGFIDADHHEAKGKSRSRKEKEKHSSSPAAAAALLSGQSPSNIKRKPSCSFCDKNHLTSECGSASRLSTEEKVEIIKKKKLCFNCLKPGHVSSKCRSFVKCVVCGEKHLAVMCNNSQPKIKKDAEKLSDENVTSPSMCQVENPEVLLQTLIVTIHGPHSRRQLRTVVDTGSQKSYILKSVAEELQLKMISEESTIHTLFGGRETERVTHRRYCATFSDIHGKNKREFLISDMPVIATNILKVPDGPWISELRQHQINITDRGNGAGPVEALLGADVVGRLLTGKKIELSTGPVAVETLFGWTLMGKLPVEQKKRKDNSFMVTNLQISDASIQEMWSLDAIGIQGAEVNKSRQELEEAALKHHKETITQLKDGRYEVHLPWIDGHKPLESNREMAVARLKATTKKLEADGMMESYHKIFQDWEEQGITESVEEINDEKLCFYLPHRPVYKPSSTTTPIRPVFDASARKKGCPSLNMCLEKGPNLLELIPDILTRFRMRRYGIIADIRKAFLQMSVTEEHRDFLRFLWYDSLEPKKIKEYRHCRVVFGVTSSPFLLAATLNHHLDQAGDEDKLVAQLLKKSFYVDNCVTSLDTKEECLEFQTRSTDLLQKGKFELREWEFGFDNNDRPVPLLGMLWIPGKDTIYCDLKSVLSSDWSKCTKRNILSAAHRIYDPLGLLSPFIISAKMILQKTWELKLGWDDELPTSIKDEFEKWVDQVKELENYRIPRWLAPESETENNWSLHCFTDASQDGYAAVIYLRNEINAEVTVNIVQARARVSPKKRVTIPRLELVACLIGARLSSTVMRAMGVKIPIWYWSDSTAAIAWIKREETWNVFVQNRVTEIRELTNPEDWNHVPGEQNPADYPSRGITCKKMKESNWLEGPEWLKKSEGEWPHTYEGVDEKEVNEEKRKTVVSCLQQQKKTSILIPFLRYSDYGRMLRGIAWIRRFINYILKKPVDNNPLNEEEIGEAEKVVIYQLQQESFIGIQDSSLAALKPFQDEGGIIRLKTKIISLENESELFKTPCVLPNQHEVVRRLIRWYHINNMHAGVQTLQLLLREKFWIVRSRQLIKKVIRSCIYCVRHSAKNINCLPAPLPKERIEQCRPFEVVGVDLAGPLFLKTGEKVWIVLYTCAVYRAVHLEITQTLSTDGFIQSFRRFCGRRGRPRMIYSDNGTNFKGAYNLFKKVNWEKVLEVANIHRIKWKFNPVTAAWWGGFWERMVGVVKTVLKRVLGRTSLTYEELMTIMIETEAIVNRRPLTYVSEDNEDLSPLTPAMFLDDAPIAELPEADLSERSSLNQRWKYRIAVKDQLQKRFRKEYISQLIHREKSRGPRDVKVGEIVLVGQDNLKRIDWPLGKVLEILPSRDGIRRTVKVKTKSGIIVRPVQRLYPLEVECEEPEEELGKDGGITTRYGRRVKVPNRFSFLSGSYYFEE